MTTRIPSLWRNQVWLHTCKPSTQEVEQDDGKFEVSQVSKQQTLKSIKEFSQIWDFLSFLRTYSLCDLPKA